MRGGGQYIIIIIRAGLWIPSMSNSRTEFVICIEFDTYTQTPPPALDMRSHLIMEKPEILISLSNIPSCEKVSHKHKNKVDLIHKSDNTDFFRLS